MTGFSTRVPHEKAPSGYLGASHPSQQPAAPDIHKWNSQVVESEKETDSVNDEKCIVDNEINRPPNLNPLQAGTVSVAAAPYGSCDLCEVGRRASHRSRTRSPSNNSLSKFPTIDERPTDFASASRVSTDAYGNTYPEGGLQAWLCVFGSFSGLMVALGLMNTIGTYHAYLVTHQLSSSSESALGWLFGIYAFLAFFGGIQIGPVFDACGPRYLILAGSVFLLLNQLLLGICYKYWHFVIVFGILGGLGTSLVFTPSISAVGHFFLHKRGQATGLAAIGGSMGGIIFPLVLQALFPKVGFAWATRVVALIDLVLLIFANLFIRSRLPSKPASLTNLLPNFFIFRDPVFALTTAAVFFVEWGIFAPLTYLSSYAFSHGVGEAFSYQLIAILNAGSCFGRYIPGLLADKIGRFNTMILTVVLCLISTLATWLPANNSIALMVVYAVIFGFGSGSSISLTPVCVGQLCKVENYGRYYATCYTLVSFGSLTGIPIAGTILQRSPGGNTYSGLILFTGASWAAAVGLFTLARGIGGGWKWSKVY